MTALPNTGASGGNPLAAASGVAVLVGIGLIVSGITRSRRVKS
ncbi:MAG: LPXTG cell wall anchor domain-containing protein [Propionibacterium sp.]|nr:LPXTG cell wall anchor domain-containing protein [Propionibacterium sp.]